MTLISECCYWLLYTCVAIIAADSNSVLVVWIGFFIGSILIALFGQHSASCQDATSQSPRYVPPSCTISQKFKNLSLLSWDHPLPGPADALLVHSSWVGANSVSNGPAICWVNWSHADSHLIGHLLGCRRIEHLMVSTDARNAIAIMDGTLWNTKTYLHPQTSVTTIFSYEIY